MLRLGRDYTNSLVFDYLGDSDKRALEKGEIDLASMNAIALEKAKEDVKRQIELTLKLGMQHVELDGDSPNNYLEFSEKRRKEIKKIAEKSDVSLSLHLPYSYVGTSLCAPQEDDRKVAVELHKRYMQFAADSGVKYINTHPGAVPFYHRIGRYKDLVHDSLAKSLLELGEMSDKLGLAFHLENNTAFDGVYYQVEDCLAMVREIREKGVELYFNLDIGHWFTRADVGEKIPDPPEKIMESVPAEFIKELHLNDYVPGKHMFHPPIHLEWGLLKRENLKRYAELVKKKGVEIVVLETAMKETSQVLKRHEILEQESKFIRGIFRVD